MQNLINFITAGAKFVDKIVPSAGTCSANAVASSLLLRPYFVPVVKCLEGKPFFNFTIRAGNILYISSYTMKIASCALTVRPLSF